MAGCKRVYQALIGVAGKGGELGRFREAIPDSGHDAVNCGGECWKADEFGRPMLNTDVPRSAGESDPLRTGLSRVTTTPST
jgi:hypothetical protein